MASDHKKFSILFCIYHPIKFANKNWAHFKEKKCILEFVHGGHSEQTKFLYGVKLVVSVTRLQLASCNLVTLTTLPILFDSGQITTFTTDYKKVRTEIGRFFKQIKWLKKDTSNCLIYKRYSPNLMFRFKKKNHMTIYNNNFLAAY